MGAHHSTTPAPPATVDRVMWVMCMSGQHLVMALIARRGDERSVGAARAARVDGSVMGEAAQDALGHGRDANGRAIGHHPPKHVGLWPAPQGFARVVGAGIVVGDCNHLVGAGDAPACVAGI